MIRLPKASDPVRNVTRARANAGAWMMLGLILFFVAMALLQRFG